MKKSPRKGQFILIVLDGFGVGAMDGSGANTALHILQSLGDLKLPHLESLGLGNLPGLSPPLLPSPQAVWGHCLLQHKGADTFWGHQEILGSIPANPANQPFHLIRSQVENALKRKGYSVRPWGAGNQILLVNECVTVGDNLETAPGLNHNVTAPLDLISFEEVKSIAEVVREISRVSRVIAFGGEGVSVDQILAAYASVGDLGGVGSSQSGVYEKGYQVIHLGCRVDPEKQVPHLIREQGYSTVLLGKAADIIRNPGGLSDPVVDTECCFQIALEIVRGDFSGFLCANIQETDLAGHREDVGLYGEKLRLADHYLGQLSASLRPGDILAVTGDHGNDPLIGHSRHTREKTPLLLDFPGKRPCRLGERTTLSDTAATVCDFFGASPPENGRSYLTDLRQG